MNSQSANEHQNIPEAHQGLHSFLYSSENEHGDVVNIYVENDGTEIVDLQNWRSQLGKLVVFAISFLFQRKTLSQSCHSSFRYSL